MPPPSADKGLADEHAFSESLVGSDGADDDGAGDAPTTVDAPADEAADRPDWIGKRLGNFRLLGLLGQGTMGMVIRAKDVNLGRVVALKVLRKRVGELDDSKRVSQFLLEARAASRIEHPNVAHIYEINHHKGWWYIATELIEGGTLRELVQAAGKLSPDQACPLIADAAAALAVAHQLGIVHRDVKPQNLMITRGGRCKVVDFGLVRVDDPNDPFDLARRGVGTPIYLAPEASKRGTPTSALDVYGLGATLHYALAGRPPFLAKDKKTLAKKHAQAPRPDVRVYNPDCSEQLADLIKRCLAVAPSERPSAADLATMLRVENIGGLDPASLLMELSGSGVRATGASGLGLSGTGHGSRSLSRTAPAVRRRRRRAAWIAGAVIVGATAVGLLARIVGVGNGAGAVASRDAFAERFPAAPETYGVLPAGALPAGPPGLRPDFGWVGRRDPGSARYVASREGRHFYAVDNPDAALIPADLAVFYDTATAARADGRENP